MLTVCAQEQSIPSVVEGSVEYFKLLLESKLAFQNGDFETALPQLIAVVSANPRHIESWYMLGTIYQKRHQYDLAKNAFERAIDVNPGYIPAYQGLAAAQESRGQFEEALLSYEFFIENYDGNGKEFATFRTAELLCRFGRYYDALPLYQNLAVDMESPFFQESMYYLNNIRHNIAQYKGQHLVLDKVPHIVPQRNNCMPSALAATLIYWGEPTSVEELVIRLQDTKEGGYLIDMVDYLRELGYAVKVSKGDFDDIVYWLKHGVPVMVNQILDRPSQPDITHLRTIYGYDRIKGSVYTSDRFQMPMQSFLTSWKQAENIMIVVVPSSKSGLFEKSKVSDLEYIARADQYYRQQHYDMAYDMYLEAEIENENNVKAKLGQVKSLIKLDKVDEAKSELRTILEKNPANQEALFLLGIVYFNEHEYDTAFDYLQRCVKVDESVMPEAHNFLGYVLIEQGKFQQGIRELERAIEIKPDYIHPHYNLARAYAQLGQPNRAIHHLKICVSAGFITYEQLVNDPVFRQYATDPEFEDLDQG